MISRFNYLLIFFSWKKAFLLAVLGQRLSPLKIVDFRNGGGHGAEFCHIFLRYFSVETLYMMFIVHLYILNGYIEFKTPENDYARTVHEGTTQGLRLFVNLLCLVQISQLQIYSLPFFRELRYGYLMIKLYGLVEN